MDSRERCAMLLTALLRLKGSLAQVQEIHERSYEGDTSPELRQKIEVDLEQCKAVLDKTLDEHRSSNR
jgi:hypothetical protein